MSRNLSSDEVSTSILISSRELSNWKKPILNSMDQNKKDFIIDVIRDTENNGKLFHDVAQKMALDFE
jgi:hypothetical protein